MSLYADVILDYYKTPRNYGTINDADASARDVNTMCGDDIRMDLRINSGVVAEVKFSGHGCAISQASASMLTELIMGKTLEEAKAVTKEDVLSLLNIELSPMRLKCALLGLKVMKLAAYNYSEKRKE